MGRIGSALRTLVHGTRTAPSVLPADPDCAAGGGIDGLHSVANLAVPGYPLLGRLVCCFMPGRACGKPVLDEFPVVEIFAPTPLFCDDTWIYMIRDGKLLFAEDRSLSGEGGKLIADELARRYFADSPSR